MSFMDFVYLHVGGSVLLSASTIILVQIDVKECKEIYSDSLESDSWYLNSCIKHPVLLVYTI